MAAIDSGPAIKPARNERITDQQNLLNLILTGLVSPGIALGLISVILWGWQNTPMIGALIGFGVQPFCLLAYGLGRYGQVRLASCILILALFLAMTSASILFGVGHAIDIGYALTVLTACLLLSTPAAIVTALLSTLTHLAIGLIQSSGGLLVTPPLLASVALNSAILGAGLTALIAFTSIYSTETRMVLAREKKLRSWLEENQLNLDTLSEDRTRDQEHLQIKIRTAAEIACSISALVDPQELLDQFVELIQTRFNYFYAGAFLLDAQGKFAQLRAGTGEAGREMLVAGYKLEVGGNSMVGWTTAKRQARIAQDVTQETFQFDNPWLQNSRSALALPILAGERTLGAITIHSEQLDAFDPEDMTLLQGLTDILATALENSRLFLEVQAQMQEAQTLHRQYLMQAWSRWPERVGSISYTSKGTPNGSPFEVGIDLEALDASEVLEIPLKLRDESIGSLILEAEKSSRDGSAEVVSTWTADELALVQSVTTQAALALENARLLEVVQRRADRERLAGEIADRFRATHDPQMILQTAARELRKALNADRALVLIQPTQPRTGDLPEHQGPTGTGVDPVC